MYSVLKDRTGEINKSRQGYSLKIVAYRNRRDIDVIVDGKHLCTGVHYSSFKRGSLTNPYHYTDRVGEKFKSNEGYALELVAYRSKDDVDIRVDNKHLLRGRRYSDFKEGSIRNPYHPSVCGIGYLGMGEYETTSNSENRRHNIQYTTWSAMLVRCYSKRSLVKYPTYTTCVVTPAWLNFQVYAAWYAENSYTFGDACLQLDKDILFKGNAVYGPETCILIPAKLNSLLTHIKTKNTGLPVGVVKHGVSYQARLSCKMNKNHAVKHLGSFKTPEEAFAAYKQAKEAYIKEMADYYKQLVAPKDQAKFKRVYDALYAYEVSIDD